MRTTHLIGLVTMYLLAAVLLTAAANGGDRLAVLTQQHKEQAAIRHVEVLANCVAALQSNRVVYIMQPRCSESRPEACADPVVDARYQWIWTHNKWCVQLASD